MLYILLYCDTIIIKKHPVLNQYNEAWPYGDTSVTIDLFVMVTLNKLINEKDKKWNRYHYLFSLNTEQIYNSSRSENYHTIFNHTICTFCIFKSVLYRTKL